MGGRKRKEFRNVRGSIPLSFTAGRNFSIAISVGTVMLSKAPSITRLFPAPTNCVPHL
jgi:hypothetical protein